MKKSVLILAFLLLSFSVVNAQTKTKFNYQAQKSLIPAELGKVYLGMPLIDFAKAFDLRKAEVGDTRFEWLELRISIGKGNVETLTVRIHGLTADDKSNLLKRESLRKADQSGFEYDHEFDRLLVDKIPTNGFVYAMYIEFKADFDLKSYVIKTFGRDGEVRKADDEYHFFDIQWTKKTPDGLIWLIRSFHEGDSRNLQLFGRIDGTEWEIEES